MITMSLFQALMYENLHVKNIMIKYKEMTWFNGKLIGSYLGGARFEFLLAPLFYTNLFIYFTRL